LLFLGGVLAVVGLTEFAQQVVALVAVVVVAVQVVDLHLEITP
jgi:hypothetical protein